MKVLEKGNSKFESNSNETVRAVCKHCQAKLEIQPKDVRRKLGLVFWKYCFICPECKMTMNIKLRKLSWNFEYWVRWYNSEF